MVAQGDPVSQLAEQGLEPRTCQSRGFSVGGLSGCTDPFVLRSHAVRALLISEVKAVILVPVEFPLDLWGL